MITYDRQNIFIVKATALVSSVVVTTKGSVATLPKEFKASKAAVTVAGIFANMNRPLEVLKLHPITDFKINLYNSHTHT